MLDKAYYSDSFRRVREFMLGGGQVVPDGPHELDPKTRVLRSRLILEEAMETIDALGVVIIDRDHGHLAFHDLELEARLKPFYDEKGIVDGLCDLQYVLTGTFVSMGVPDECFHREVHANNMLKVIDPKWDESGKLQKPPGHLPPRIGAMLDAIKNMFSKAVLNNSPNPFETFEASTSGEPNADYRDPVAAAPADGQLPAED